MVLDLLSGAVVFVGEGKGADALKPFWKRLKRSRAKIEAVAMDMSPAYLSVVQTHLSKAVIVFDHFQIIKLFNERLSDLHRELYREGTEQLHDNVLKGTRWLLLKNPENLDNTRDESKRLHEALTLNQPLATAYYMKEDLRRVWEQPDRSPPIAAESSTTTATASRPDRWKEPTPKSASCNAKPTAFEMPTSSNSRSTLSTKPAMNWSDEGQ